jgi:hypothetical protein
MSDERPTASPGSPAESRRAVATFRHMQHALHEYDNALTDEAKNAAAEHYMQAEAEHFAELHAERLIVTSKVKRYIGYVIIAAFLLGLVIAFIFIPITNLQNATKGVHEVGPCRQAFERSGGHLSGAIKDPECQFQAALIFRAWCATHRAPALCAHVQRVRVGNPRNKLPARIAGAKGVVPGSGGGNPGGQPGPPSGGSGGGTGASVGATVPGVASAQAGVDGNGAHACVNALGQTVGC